MNNIYQRILKSTLLILLLMLLSSLLINLLYYFNIISINGIKYVKMIFSLLSFFIGGIYIGQNSDSKGYLSGIKLSIIMTIVMLALSLIFNNFSVKRILYYLIMSFCITFGSMIGINKKIS